MGLKPIEQSFNLTYSYALYFTENVFNKANQTLRNVIESNQNGRRIKLLFVVDDVVLKAHSYLENSIPAYCDHHKDVLEFTRLLSLPGGESVKNDPGYIDKVLEAIDNSKICRHSYVIAIGGGALIDLVGYTASIAHRGVRFIRVPTTVLSQNDAAVGVKNGVNILGKKNFIGTFSPPYAVINDSKFLNSLEDRDWIAGIAEAVKVSLIKDKYFFKYIRDHIGELKSRDMSIMQKVIYRCAELHMQHIAEGGDPFEQGSSRPLDFGHWSAHKIENMTNYEIRHGEAVAKGMALDLIYASKIGLISSSLANDIVDMLLDIGFDVHIPVSNEVQVEELLQGIEEFREHLGGMLTITLIEGIGLKRDVNEIDRNIMKESISHLNAKLKLA